MNYLVCYDIAQSRRLQRVARVLKNYGIRLQYSFFQCQIDEKRMLTMKDQVLEEIDCKKDYFFIYPLCGKCLEKPIVDGIGQVLKMETFVIL